MKALTLLALIVLWAALPASAQESSSASRLPEDARFEMVQVPWNNTTFRLDRFSGVIDRLGTCTKDDTVSSNKCWKEMIVIDIPKSSPAAGPRFQILLNGVLKSIFLLDTRSGLTWQYALDPTEKWHPFIDCSDKSSPQCLWRPLP